MIAGKQPLEVVAENIRLCDVAMQNRLGVKPRAFGAPYGFAEGIAGREDLQELILSLGYWFITSKYSVVPDLPNENLQVEHFRAIADSVARHQPYYYPTGLLELPYVPVTDVGAFRSRNWTLDEYVRAIRRCVRRAIELRAVYNWCSHPSVLYVEDPEFRIIEAICEEVKASNGKAMLVDRNAAAARARRQLPLPTSAAAKSYMSTDR